MSGIPPSTLTCRPAREAYLRKAADPARTLSQFIARAFRDLLGMVPPFGFTLEISPADRLHAHGVYIPAIYAAPRMS